MLNTEKQLSSKFKNENFKTTMTFLSIVVLSLIIDFLLHQVVNIFRTVDYLPFELVLEKLPIIIGILFVCYFFICLSYAIIQNDLPGTRVKKSLIFGSIFSVLWVVYFFELVLLFDYDIVSELFNGLSDGLPILVMCFLLGIFLSDDTKAETTTLNSQKVTNVLIIVVFGVIFTVGRFSLNILGTIFNTNAFEANYNVYLVETMIWTFGYGLLIGMLYIFCLPAFNNRNWSFIEKSNYFAVFMFGIQWIFYTAFWPLVVDSNTLLSDVIVRTIGDILVVVAIIVIVDLFIQKNESPIE